ncbi:MAG: orotidine-5'-phosphate decarboxylase [Propionibacteriales bacterium]|nr:orotidine-5'-phosphate decarboxylase [Propionibacteriales bacterium]
MTFGSRLRHAMDTRGPLCVGVDPHPELLLGWGLTDDPRGLERFALTVTEALAPQVAVLKPQSAFFERHGAAGIAVLEKLIPLARDAGCLVLMDAKRGDIGSTMQAYADAYVTPTSPLACDAITANPYLGFGSLEILIDYAVKFDAGVFVVTLTSNPEGPEVQRSSAAGGGTVAGSILRQIAAVNQAAEPMGSIGAVVGTTIGEPGEDLRINGPLLAPGLGAQGGTPEDAARIFAGVLENVVPAAAREVLRAGPDVAALRDAARGLNAALSWS